MQIPVEFPLVVVQPERERDTQTKGGGHHQVEEL